MSIEEIISPECLIDKNPKQLQEIAKAIRIEIIDKTASYGGHLSSNLGVVELTIALHKAFDFKVDKLLFDVSHQAYAHKILTGRKLEGLRTKHGISGYLKREESSYDHFEAGHASTSLSTAYGMAIARDLNKEKHHLVAVIGDGSIANGMAFEAMNSIGHNKHKVIIVLNDNDMSISHSTGAFARYLRRIRFSPKYLKNKEAYRRILFKTKFGYNFFRFTQSIKNKIASYISPSNLFEQMGLGYIGPINGHNLKALDKAFKYAKRSGLSVVVHVKTIKGKGYKPAEDDKSGYWHGVTPFDIASGLPKSNHPDKISWSHLYSDLIAKYMKDHQETVLINPATIRGSNLDDIFKDYPARTFDVGIAEEHALTMAAGLSLGNKWPIVSVYATFLQRALDQVSHDIARQNLKSLLLIDRAGLVGPDGDTHQGIFDQAFLINTPGMVVAMASDIREAAGLFKSSYENNVPFSIRYPRDYVLKTIDVEPIDLPIGKWIIKYESTTKKLALISYGPVLKSIEQSIGRKDITLINAIYQKPLDNNVLSSLLGHETIIVHDAYATSLGFVNSVNRALNELGYKGKVINMAIKDEFVRQATIKEQMEYCQVDDQSVVKIIFELIK
ncbi:MAG TPA: 1-deoxy-D-xylulose-5-phosphate synthase [Bacilli bacterium]|nr:1-deoxy-D-xylulose-5-phosphate synthase [Bacilli bacterium]